MLTKIISLGEVVFPYFQIGRFEGGGFLRGGVLSELGGFLPFRVFRCEFDARFAFLVPKQAKLTFLEGSSLPSYFE